MSERMTVGKTGVPREVEGMPAFHGDKDLTAVVTAKNMADGKPFDCRECGIALGFEEQLRCPIKPIIGKAVAYIPLPSKHGVQIEGAGKTRWAMFAYRTSWNKTAQALLRSNDRAKPGDEGTLVTLKPQRKSERGPGKAVKNARNPKRESKGTYPQRGRRGTRDYVREQGVRNYSGRTWP